MSPMKYSCTAKELDAMKNDTGFEVHDLTPAEEREYTLLKVASTSEVDHLLDTDFRTTDWKHLLEVLNG